MDETFRLHQSSTTQVSGAWSTVPNELERTQIPMSEQNTKMWSGRFREPLDKRFEDWQRSFPFDYCLLPQEVAASKAHAQAIAAAGILTPTELTTTLAGLEAVRTI